MAMACVQRALRRPSARASSSLQNQRGPWKHLDDVEYATLEWVDWYNNRRPLRRIGDIPPAEMESA
jgi:transposase InsO family protein